MSFRPCRPGEMPFPVALSDLRLIERALEHELAIANFNLHAIHATRHERMQADSDRRDLERVLADLRDGV